MRLRIEDDRLVVPMPWWRRAGSFYWVAGPAMPLAAITWVHPCGPIDMEDVQREVQPHWLVYASRGIAVNFTDPRATNRADRGRAFVHRWTGIDGVVVQARSDSPWTKFVISTRHGAAITAQLKDRGVPVWPGEKDDA